jgi:hypothetical protein
MPASWMQALEKELWGHSSLRYNRTFISDENWKIVSPYRNNSQVSETILKGWKQEQH